VSTAYNLRIEGTGVRLVFYYSYGVSIVHSVNCTLIGFVLDSDPPNYAQGIVHSSVGSEFLASFSPDFIPPDTTQDPFHTPGGLVGAKVAFWDADTRRMLPLGNQFMANSTRVGAAGGVSDSRNIKEGDSSWRIGLHSAVRGAIVAGKTPVTIFPRGGFTWTLNNCSAIVTENVTIHSGGNMGFHESAGAGGNAYRGVKIVRRPGSSGLLALNADGFHSDSVGIGPTLEDSEISFTGDDFLNIHNRMLVICRALGDNALAIVDVGNTLHALRPGDSLSFYQLQPGCKQGCAVSNERLGAGMVSNSAVATDPTTLAACRKTYTRMQEPPYSASLVIHSLPDLVYRVVFTSSLPPAVTARPYNLVQYVVCLCARVCVLRAQRPSLRSSLQRCCNQ